MPHRSFSKVAPIRLRQIIKGDVISILLGILTVLALRPSGFEGPTGMTLTLLIPVTWIYFLQSSRSWRVEIVASNIRYFQAPLLATFKSGVFVSSFAYIVKEPFSRLTFLSIYFLSTLLILCTRFALEKSYISKLTKGKQLNVLILGNNLEVETIKSQFESPFEIKFYQFNVSNISQIGPSELIESICKIIQSKDIAVLVMGESVIETKDLSLYIPLIFSSSSSSSSSSSLEIFVLSQNTALHNHLKNIDNSYLLRYETSIFTDKNYAKRGFDVLFSLAALAALTPLLLVAAFLVKTTSKGSIFYLDNRIGQYNKIFTFPKFRSMYMGADKTRQEFLGSPDEKMPQRYRHDPRITKYGKFIRRWSIDELPQFWSVLKGDMSVVGPRPILSEELVNVRFEDKIRFNAKPGLTGLWQVSGRKMVLWEERMRQDRIYVENWSFIKDMVLVVRTVFTIIGGKGAM